MSDTSEAGEVRTQRSGAIGFVRQVVSIVSEQQIVGFAQMVAYNILFATAPLLMVVTAGAAGITRAVNSDLENPAQPILEWMQETLPADAASFLQQPIERAINTEISWVFSIGAVFALWGARGAVAAVIRGLNMAYGIGKDPRPFVQHSLRSIVLTLLLVLLIAVGGLVFTLGTTWGEEIAIAVGLGDLWNAVLSIARWPVIAGVLVIAVTALHRFGPAVKDPFSWYIPGALFAVVAMHLVTLGLGVWFRQSDGFSEAYGIFGSVLAFVLWLYLMSFVLLLGGVINAVVHQRHFEDSTD